VHAKVVWETACRLEGELPQCRNLPTEARCHGHKRGTKATATQAAERSAELMPVVRELRREGKTLQGIADELNARGYVTGRDTAWSHVAVLRLLNRDGQANRPRADSGA
jgi:Recombinase